MQNAMKLKLQSHKNILREHSPAIKPNRFERTPSYFKKFKQMHEREMNKYKNIKPIETETNTKIQDMPQEYDKVKEEYGVKAPLKTHGAQDVRIRDVRIHRSNRRITDIQSAQKQPLKTERSRPNRLQSHKTGEKRIYVPHCSNPKYRQQGETVNYELYHQILEGRRIFGKGTLKQVLGTGASAKVRLLQTEKGQKYAVKIYEKYKLIEPRRKKRVMREIQLLGKMQSHPNIIEFYQAYEDKRQIHLIFEYLSESTTLLSYFRKNSLSLSIPLIKNIFSRVSHGILHLHAQGFIHRDVKADNILLGWQEGEMIVKVIDFGFMDVMKEFNIGKCGTPNYMAPEVIEGGVYDGAKVDGWALAILLFYLLEGRYPFRGYDEKDLFKNIKTKQFTLQKHQDPHLHDLFGVSLTKEASKRQSIEEMLKSPWFQS